MICRVFLCWRDDYHHGEVQQRPGRCVDAESQEDMQGVRPCKAILHCHFKLGNLLTDYWIRTRWRPRSPWGTRGTWSVSWWRSWVPTCWSWAAMATASSRGREELTDLILASQNWFDLVTNVSKYLRALLGSVSDHCARNAKCPVLIVKHRENWCVFCELFSSFSVLRFSNLWIQLKGLYSCLCKLSSCFFQVTVCIWILKQTR